MIVRATRSERVRAGALAARRRLSILALIGWALPGSAVFAQSDKSASAADAAKPLRVAAAASLRGPLDQALADWRQAGGTAATITYAGTPALVRQIEQGLPADLFFSADPDWMDHLAGRGGLRPQTRRDLLGNRLVLIARPGVEAVLPPEVRSSGVELGKGDTADRALRAALANGLGRTRLALAEVGSVPAGRYARAALEALNLWQAWSSRLAMTDNVRAALLLVARGETDLALCMRPTRNSSRASAWWRPSPTRFIPPSGIRPRCLHRPRIREHSRRSSFWRSLQPSNASWRRASLHPGQQRAHELLVQRR